MKIDQLTAVDPVATTTKGSQTPAARAKDTVSLDRSVELEKAISDAQVSAGQGRAAQLASLEAQIRSGTYQPSPSKLAEKLLSSAELDAQMLAMLQK